MGEPSKEHRRLLAEIAAEARDTEFWTGRESFSPAVMDAMAETTQQMQAIFGDRWYGEIQWNRIPEQHELNQYIIKTCQKMGVDLISTADSHFPSEDTFLPYPQTDERRIVQEIVVRSPALDSCIQKS